MNEMEAAIADVIVEAVQVSTETLRVDVETMRARLLAVEDLATKQAAVNEEVATLRQDAETMYARLDAVESRQHLSAEALTKGAEDAFTKEFAALIEAAPKRTVKRVVRDAQGRVERVVEEAVA